MSQLARFTNPVWRWPSYCIITDHWDVYKHWPSVRFTNRAQAKYSNFRTSHILWTKYELMIYVVAYSTHIKLYRKICLEKSFSISVGLLKFNLGEQRIEWNKSPVPVFWKCSMLIFVNIPYETTVPSITCVHHIKTSITRFDMFRKIYNQEILQC